METASLLCTNVSADKAHNQTLQEKQWHSSHCASGLRPSCSAVTSLAFVRPAQIAALGLVVVQSVLQFRTTWQPGFLALGFSQAVLRVALQLESIQHLLLLL